MEHITEETIRELIEFLKSHPTYKDQLADLFDPGQFVRRDEMTEVLQEIKQLRIDTNNRFEAMQEQMDRRFDQVDRRFELVYERFDQVDRRFELIDERFDRVDLQFERVYDRFDELSIALGHDFEEFNSLWLQDMLRNQGFPKLSIKKRTFIDENYEVFPDSTDVEVDVYNADPFVIGEITAITRTIDKVTLFLRKVKFLKDRKDAEPQLFYITYGFLPEIRDKALDLLENAGVKIYTVRQRDLEE